MEAQKKLSFLTPKTSNITNIIARYFVYMLTSSSIIFSEVALANAGQTVRAPDISLSLGETVGTIYDYQSSKCDDWDVPDTPSRAFVDSRKNVHLLQTHFVNREMIGSSLLELRHNCNVVYEGADSKTPSTFDNRGWIAATYTFDGQKIYGIVHNEFQGHRFGKSSCPTGVYKECWYNSLTSVVSYDSGRTFIATEPRLIAAIPFKASQTMGTHAGVFEPSNIFTLNGHQYFTANVLAPPPFRGGNCLFRTEDISDPSAWRALRDGKFEGRSINPYTEGPYVLERLCDPIGRGSLPWPIKNVVKHKSSRTWIALMVGRDINAKGSEKRSGIYFSYSKNLLEWSGPFLLMRGNTDKKSCVDKDAILYPAFLDDVDGGRNFDEVGDSFYLTYVSIDIEKCATTKNRNILYRDVNLTVIGKK